MVGLVPVVGEAADVINGVWYAAEGNYVDAALSFSSAIPVAGYAASAAKGARTAKEAADAVDAAGDAAKAADNVADAGKAADNLTPPAAPKQPKPPTNPPPAKPKDQPKSQGKGDAPSGGGKDAGPGGKGDGGPPKNRGESGGGGGKCSFVPGTQVTLAVRLLSRCAGARPAPVRFVGAGSDHPAPP